MEQPNMESISTAIGPDDESTSFTRDALKSNETVKISEDAGHRLKTKLKVTKEGTLDVELKDEASGLKRLLKPILEHNAEQEAAAATGPSPDIPDIFTKAPSSMNIVVHIVGSRGDVQPFVALGKVLKDKHKHRVRIATHLTFKGFVEQNGLEFFNIGADPAELMAYMVKNPGLIPDLHTLKSGDVGRRRESIYEILNGCWRSCIEPGDGTETQSDGSRYHFESEGEPFIADAIIANPPSFAHIHCAEKLGIPLHMMFTMPWSPTQSFPHPLVNIRATDADREMTNYISYTLVDMMTWQGLGDLINKFRNKALNLGPISVMWAPGMTHRLRIPFTYCWSPALIPKPADWGKHIAISGFYFLSLASSYTPDPALLEFLNAGPPPIYIGFGSIVVDDPDAMTRLIFKAVKLTGVRALVSKGWGGLGADEAGKPDNVFMLGNVPHDWLFQHVSAVVHHGGAGTTAAGILAGRPTVVVPFFGDQPFWGAMIARAGAGPKPIPYKTLTAESLAEQIRIALKPDTIAKAKILSAEMNSEAGAESGADYFHGSLPPKMRCSLIPDHVAVWRLKKTNLLLSAKAAIVLRNKSLIDMNDLIIYRPQEYVTGDGPLDPVTGVASVLLGTLSNLVVGAAELPSGAFHALKKGLHSRHNSLDRKYTGDGNNVTSNKKPSLSTPGSASPAILPNRGVSESSNGQTASASAVSETPEDLSLTQEVSIESEASEVSTVSQLSADSDTDNNHHHHHQQQHHDREKMDHVKHVASRAAEIGLSVPRDFANSLAQGFHNAPKLYQDHTVRPQENVTGMVSGLQAAGKNFSHGIYDGVTGVVTQPVHGAMEEGAVGFLKGVGKGIGGLVLKPAAGLFSIPADTITGAYKEIRKSGDVRLEEHIVASRVAQGEREAKDMTEHEREELVELWVITKLKALQPSLRHARTLPEMICPKCRKRHASFGDESVSDAHHELKNQHTQGSSQLSPVRSENSVIIEPAGAEGSPIKTPATVVTSTVMV